MRTYSLVTFGCQMNQHDSDRVAEVLSRAGYEQRENVEEAELVLLNTCSVREKAEQKLRSEVGRLAELKRQKQGMAIGLLGCVAQQEGERLLKRMPALDLVVGPDHIAALPELLAELELGALPRVRTGFDNDEPEFLSAQPEFGQTRVSAFVTVMKGCDERCSFCIVPHTRGPERYRPASEIVREIERLVASGTREVTLLGQTVNSYRDPEGSSPAFVGITPRASLRREESEFPRLLERIVREVPGLVRLRYTSPHPRHLTEALIQAHAELAPLVRHVHLPVQSGSNRVLKRMIRRYTVEDYEERVARLRERVPGVTLSTDIIVGFPGETREDFQATLDLVERVRFSGVFAFKYSVRPYTPAKQLPDDVPESEKSARLTELLELANGHRSENLGALIGSAEAVLVEGRSKGGAFTGRTERNEIVHFDAGPHDPTGRLITVRIERAFKNSLFGVWLERPQTPTPAPEESSGNRARRSLPVFAGE